ncbi:glutathione S-transferase family protein [Hyphococcus sp.]|uniref:glutathione S-transferase family protein n=1 Tax=Hyphococcus sp. TaxID=2038636 RepID=UPI003CCBC4B5
MSLKLIHFPMTRSLRVVWALYELGIEAEIETRPFVRASIKHPDYVALNPLGKSPFLRDGDINIVESVAIIEYLANTYGEGKLTRSPKDKDYADYLQWREFGEAGMGGYISMLLGHTVLLPEEQRIVAMKDWATQELQNCLNYLEAHLSDDGYLLGEFSIADISVGYVLYLVKLARHGKLFGDKTNAYFKRLTAREAWIAASGLQPPQ